MADDTETRQSPANDLCKACGLCCTGHLFGWTKLRSAELNSAQALGLRVFREPRQRGFNQPCPLWNGECTIYTSPHYPRFCRIYECALLEKTLDEVIPLPEALATVQKTKEMIAELESLLPASTNPNFRERLVAHMGQEKPGSEFMLKAEALLAVYEESFGVKDFVEKPEEM